MDGKLSKHRWENEKKVVIFSVILIFLAASIILFLSAKSSNTVLHQLDQKIIYPHYDFKHLTEKYFEIGMKLDDFLIQLVKYCNKIVYVTTVLHQLDREII